MTPSDTLQTLLDRAGYELADHRLEGPLLIHVNERKLSQGALRRLINEWVILGHIRPRIIKPKDDEAFRLFVDET